MEFSLHHFGGGKNISGLCAEKTALMNVSFKLSRFRANVIFQFSILPEKRWRHFIHFFVGTLCGKLHRNQKFPTISIAERDPWIRKQFFERPEDTCGPLSETWKVIWSDHIGLIVSRFATRTNSLVHKTACWHNRSALSLYLVTKTMHGLEQLLSPSHIYLFPQEPDMNINSIGERIRIHIPHVLKNHTAREHNAGTPH